MAKKPTTRSSRKTSGNRLAAARRKSPPDATIKAHAARFNRIRQDHSSETAEDYVELIAHLIATRGEARTVDIAEHLGVSHVTVTKTLGRLRREGLIHTEPYRSIFLTDEGKLIAEQCAARHELVVRFLRQVGVSVADAENDAEGIEHHLSEATLRAIQKFVESDR